MPALESPVRAAHRRGQPGSVLEGWCDPFPGYYLHHPSQRQPSPTFSVVVEALRYRSAGLGTARSNVAAKATGARVQGAMNRAPLECDSHTSDVPRQHLAASRLAGETKGFAKRTAPVAGKAARRTAPRRGRSTNGYGTWRRNEKRARRPFLNDLQTSLELYRSIFGAGNESCTRALSLCFPITFSTVVISEELNYSLVFRPRQQSSSNHFHQRPRMIHPPVVTPDASSC